MQLTPGQTKLLAFWGTIQQQVSQRASTADIWNAVRTDAAAEGVTLSGVQAIDMGRLRSIAASQRNSMEQLSRLAPNAVITGQMIGTDVSARSLTDQALTPSWTVRFQHDVIVNGQLQTLWRSSVFDGSLPATKGDLMRQLNSDGEAMAQDYNVSHAGIGLFQISAV